MTPMRRDHDSLSLNTIPRLVADPRKLILFPLILNPDMTNETLVLDSIMHSPFAEAQLSILSELILIECKQNSIFSLTSTGIMLHIISLHMNTAVKQSVR